MWCVTTLAAVLLTATTYQVDSLLPYHRNSSEECDNPKTEYKESVWCCSRCSPGSWLKGKCDETADSVCEACPSGQYMEGWNYRPHCSSCKKCAKDKGLEYRLNCTTSTRSRCVCQPGMYCIVGFDNPYCTECYKYKLCNLGFGVSKQGTAESNVKCLPCPEGTFSDKVSHTEPCKPHTRCRKAVVEQGNVTSDTVCEPMTDTVTPQSTTETRFTVAYTTTSLLTTSIPMKPDSPLTPSRSSDPVTSNHPATTPPGSTDVNLVTVVVPAVIGCVILLFIILLVVLWQSKIINRKGGQKLDPLAVDPHEQQSLMEIQEPCTDLSNGSTKPLAGMENSCGMEHESLV